ncbi:MAG: hypothetical protein LBL73_04015 [Synergistaceae bacterium]|nr:hypothetical protein [Synergistaceae bacterium]
MTRYGLLVSSAAKARKAFFAIAVLALPVLLGSPGAGAASMASLAISPPQGGDPTYVYVDLMDAGEISRRLQKSETLRSVFAQWREILREIPASEMSFMSSVSGDEAPAFQMALKLGGGEKEILGRIASGKASADELDELFGKVWNRITVEAPLEGVSFYRLNPFDVYFSSNGELLIFADSPEGVRKSIQASRNGLRRFSPARKSDGRNLILVALGKDHSSLVADELSGIAWIQGDGAFPEKFAFEMELALRPGGWEIDLFTDAIKPLFGAGFFERNAPKPYGSFFRAGGGRLLAALDGIPYSNPLSAGAYMQLMSIFLGMGSVQFYDDIEKLTVPGVMKSISSGLAASDRLNFAVTAAPDGKMSAYVMARESAGTNWQKEGEAISRAAGIYGSLEAARAGRFEEVPGANWNHVYRVRSGESGSGSQPDITAAFGDSSALIGFLTPDLLAAPFVADSAFYEALTKAESAYEIVYVDMKLLRRVLADRVRRYPDGRYDTMLTALAILPFLDIREAGVLTLSPGHFRFTFKTGWLDFDDRESVRSALGSYGLAF